jgi:hypothetical protein
VGLMREKAEEMYNLRVEIDKLKGAQVNLWPKPAQAASGNNSDKEKELSESLAAALRERDAATKRLEEKASADKALQAHVKELTVQLEALQAELAAAETHKKDRPAQRRLPGKKLRPEAIETPERATSPKVSAPAPDQAKAVAVAAPLPSSPPLSDSVLDLKAALEAISIPGTPEKDESEKAAVAAEPALEVPSDLRLSGDDDLAIPDDLDINELNLPSDVSLGEEEEREADLFVPDDLNVDELNVDDLSLEGEEISVADDLVVPTDLSFGVDSDLEVSDDLLNEAGLDLEVCFRLFLFFPSS